MPPFPPPPPSFRRLDIDRCIICNIVKINSRRIEFDQNFHVEWQFVSSNGVILP